MAPLKDKSGKKTKEEGSNATSKSGEPLKYQKSKSFPIVCLGGSAGAFEAIEKFFSHMSTDSGMAFVVVMHLNANHLSSVAELIQHFTPMPVVEAKDGVTVEPDKVYVIPPSVDMGIHNRKLLLLASSMPKGYSMPIDYFLQSLAEDQWNRSVAIILSGMGSDGETGVRMIKEKLGMVMVQDPVSAQYNSMPKSAISSNLVDYVLLPEEMPIKLIQYLNHPALADDALDHSKSENKDANSIQKILMLLRSHNGHDFSQYKKNTITRRIDRRLAFHQLPDYLHYINYLRENPHEIDVLFNELLIGVTRFFRDPYAFDSLKDRLHALLRSKPESDPVRVWVAGCSTGEEAYSVAMLLMEHFIANKIKKMPKVQIFATDLDTEAIELARAGSYLDNITAYISPERLERFFVKKEDRYVVKKELREMIVFAQHNLIKDAPFTKLDLLCCRNVLIYLTAELQKKVIPIFHYSLNPKGILFMGPAETVGGFTEMFVPIEPKWKMFERKEGSFTLGKMLDFPFQVSKQPTPIFKMDEYSKSNKKKTLADTFTRILLDQYTPASVLINEAGDILYINGKTGKFLELNSGEAVMNVYQMAKEELKYILGNAIHQVRIHKNPVVVNDIRIKEEDHIRLASVKVSLVQDVSLQGTLMVVFEDKGLLKKEQKRKANKNPQATLMAEELEKELMYTKQQLHTTIEQMETSLEELKSTNEELQSTNEELQSTNEESLTTKEEMQSLNEELMTINVQYQSKAEELIQLNNDMKNLLDNTEIGTIFLDIHLVILRFTPQVKKLFNVITSDIGRSITDIAFNFEYKGLEADIREVIENLVTKEREIKTKDEWYNLRIMPYRTLDNFINGAVLTFHKITSIKLMENKLKALREAAVTFLYALKDPALLLDKDLRITAINSAYENFFKTSHTDLESISFSVLVHEFWKTGKVDKLLRQCQHSEISMSIQHEFPMIGVKKVSITAKPSLDSETGETLMVLIMIEENVN